MNIQRTNRPLLLGTVLAVALGSSSFSSAGISILEKWGVRGSSSLGDISSGGGQNNFTFDSSGGAGIPIAEVQINDAVTTDFNGNGPWDRGTTHGFAGLQFGANQAAALKAEAILTGNTSNLAPGAVATTFVFASDLFQYTGLSATTLSLTFTLEGVVDDPLGNSIANNLTILDSNVAIFANTPNYEFISDIPSLVFEAGATLKSSGGTDAVDTATLRIDDDTGGLTETRSTTLVFDVVPGETFYVHTTLAAQAAFGDRSADAFSTLTGQFDQPQFVMSLSVPEPSSSLLLLLAGSVLATRRSRRRRR